MASRKLYDLAVKTGEYTNRNGETRASWANIGAVMQANDGGKFILLDRTFNIAGVPNPENRSNVLVSMFEPKDNQQSSKEPERQPSSSVNNRNTSNYDDIPF